MKTATTAASTTDRCRPARPSCSGLPDKKEGPPRVRTPSGPFAKLAALPDTAPSLIGELRQCLGLPHERVGMVTPQPARSVDIHRIAIADPTRSIIAL